MLIVLIKHLKKKQNQKYFKVESLEKTAQDDFQKLASAVYLQVSTISQALIFVTRSRSWSFVERPGILLVVAFLIAQLVSVVHYYFASHLSSSHDLRSSLIYLQKKYKFSFMIFHFQVPIKTHR